MALANRMAVELKQLSRDPPPGIAVWPVSDSIVNLQAQLMGPVGTVYAGGSFDLRVTIPERYPFEPPRVSFQTPVYHPNIDSQGRICLDILNMPPKGGWRPSLNIATVLLSISLLLAEPNPDDGLVLEVAQEFKYNRRIFDAKARQFTQQHAKRDVQQQQQQQEEQHQQQQQKQQQQEQQQQQQQEEQHHQQQHKQQQQEQQQQQQQQEHHHQQQQKQQQQEQQQQQQHERQNPQQHQLDLDLGGRHSKASPLKIQKQLSFSSPKKGDNSSVCRDHKDLPMNVDQVSSACTVGHPGLVSDVGGSHGGFDTTSLVERIITRKDSQESMKAFPSESADQCRPPHTVAQHALFESCPQRSATPTVSVPQCPAQHAAAASGPRLSRLSRLCLKRPACTEEAPACSEGALTPALNGQQEIQAVKRPQLFCPSL